MGLLPPPVEMLRAEGDPTLADPSPDAVLVSDAPSAAKVWALRLRLILTPVLAGTVALATTLALSSAPQMAADLVRLLHGMVLIKGLIGLGAGTLFYWRLGRPLSSGLAWRYVACLSLSAAALGWLWGLHWVPAGSALYWAGLIGLLLVGSRDPLFANLPRRPG
ncbi:hypothetical protein G3480_23745 [Thiorhodococcus mannitoliphagus]|uniref:Transmembrane protein n=1 Tax=Thiorhodococcus mannitoliphagus TaxID=329406 RepID=A0A6P1E421_9GAMM|nr:hypothetical protein [Thiorhodococcus mannitoliphagus]NEX23272.1 hypothetical protein [Thiorhodococcus mannitoliphagus]